MSFRLPATSALKKVITGEATGGQGAGPSFGVVRKFKAKAASECLAGLLLGQDPSALVPPIDARMRAFQQKLLNQLVVAGRADGANMSVERAMREVVGAEAMTHFLLAGDGELILENYSGLVA
jgi:hypothetical protein